MDRGNFRMKDGRAALIDRREAIRGVTYMEFCVGRVKPQTLNR